MRLAKKVETDIAAGILSCFDFIPALDKIPNEHRQEMAEVAAKVAFKYAQALKSEALKL